MDHKCHGVVVRRKTTAAESTVTRGTRKSIESIRPSSVQELKDKYESLDMTGQSPAKTTPTKTMPPTRKKGQPLTPISESPQSKVLSRAKKNTYQSSKVDDIRKKFQVADSPSKIGQRNIPSPVLPSVNKRSTPVTPRIATTTTSIAIKKSCDHQESSSAKEVIQEVDAIKVTINPHMPPVKPTRTFAHDKYVQDKEQIKVLVAQKYRSGHSRPSRDQHKSSHFNRRRSRSIDYDTTQANLANRSPHHDVQAVRQKVKKSVSPYHVSDLFDLTEKPQQVVEVLRKSFGPFNAIEATIPFQSDAQDIEDKVIYAKTLKATFRGRALSHYSTISDTGCISVDAKSTNPDTPRSSKVTPVDVLCKFFTEFDVTSGQVIVYPKGSSIESSKAEFVKKFATPSTQAKPGHFSWFSFSENNLYTYVMTRKDLRVISVSSDLYSPEFFHRLLTVMTGNESDQKILSSPKIKKLLTEKIPLPGDVIDVADMKVTVPWDNQITCVKPSLLLANLESEAIFKAVATLVHERRLVLTSSRLDILLESTKSLVALLYPLQWDYMFWPVVPADLVTWTAALTSPYFVGLEKRHLPEFQSAINKRNQQVLILDMDNGNTTNSVIMEVGDEVKILPKDYLRSVVKALDMSRNMTDPKDCHRDLVMTESFLKIFVDILGPITGIITEERTFNKDNYIKSVKNRQLRSFLMWFLETRLFTNFLKTFHVRYLHSKYIPLANQLHKMDLFERKTKNFRLGSSLGNDISSTGKELVNSCESSKSSTSTVGWSESALKVIETRLRALGTKWFKSFRS